jgi:chromate transporter
VQLAVFVGYRVGGVPGALIACLGAILPPTVIMMAVAIVLTRLRGEAWIGGFVKGLAPALAALLLITAYNLIGAEGWRQWPTLVLGAATLLAVAAFKAPPAIVLLLAGLAGIFLFRQG